MKIKRKQTGEENVGQTEILTTNQSGRDGLTTDKLRMLARDLIENNERQFAFLKPQHTERRNDRKIERVYSKNEIRHMVESNLIAAYQREDIISGVTEYFYKLHMTN